MRRDHTDEREVRGIEGPRQGREGSREVRRVK
jgi:hypothetical protein